MTIKSCERCGAIDSEENPIFEIIDEDGFVEERICMDCFVEDLEDAEG